MAGTIEKQDTVPGAIILIPQTDGSIQVRVDYTLVTSEGELTRSKVYQPTAAEKNTIKSFAAAVFGKIKSQEGI